MSVKLEEPEKKIEFLIGEVLELFNDHVDNGVDELRVLSALTAYVLCNHMPNEATALNAYSVFERAVDRTVKHANSCGHTIWVEGRGH